MSGSHSLKLPFLSKSNSAVLALAAAAIWGAPGSANALGTRGYAISWFQPAIYSGEDDCPAGVNQEQDWRAVFAKEGKTAEEIKALFDHLDSDAFHQAMVNRGPHGEDVCINPASLPDPSWKTVQGKHAYGMNLDNTPDGAATRNSCKHEKFAAPDGAGGIDNQLYRILGCSKAYRGSLAKEGRDGYQPAYFNERMREGLVTYLIEISGIDDPRNSDNVEVAIYQGLDPLVQDGAGSVQLDSTFRISTDTRWHNKVHGQIKDGVLTTDVFDVNLPNDPLIIPEFHFGHARLRLTLMPDGSLKGDLAGYVDWRQFYWGFAKGDWIVEKTASGNCPAEFYALQHLADGDPDPSTGECTTISTDYGVEAVRAFLIHPSGEKGEKTAAADLSQGAH
jgi:hypothetical protein